MASVTASSGAPVGIIMSAPRFALGVALIAAMEDAVARGAIDWRRESCMTFCADIYRAVLGVDPAARWRGRWRSRTGMARALRRAGFASVSEACRPIAADLGWPAIAPAEAETGDAGVIRIDGGEACAMRHASGLWVARAAAGYLALDGRAAVAAWRVLP